MTANACVLDAPWLQGRRGCIDTALGAAVWLWMHDVHRRRDSIQDIEQRWLAPIAMGQYVIARGPTACLGDDAGVRPQALLLFARFDEQAEVRYLACPQGRIATREWCSGDRLWLIDWCTPFGQTLGLRRSVMRLLQGHATRSFLGRDANRHRRVTLRTKVATDRMASEGRPALQRTNAGVF